jgi:GTP1/Obg family GTP-binding protein
MPKLYGIDRRAIKAIKALFDTVYFLLNISKNSGI